MRIIVMNTSELSTECKVLVYVYLIYACYSASFIVLIKLGEMFDALSSTSSPSWCAGAPPSYYALHLEAVFISHFSSVFRPIVLLICV